MQRFSFTLLALCFFVAALVSALPTQSKREGITDETFHMVDDVMNDPSLQTGGTGKGTVITPSSSASATPTPSSSHKHAAASVSPAAPSGSSKPSPTSHAAPSNTISATPTPTSKKDTDEKGSFLGEVPVLGQVLGLLGGGK